MKGLDEFHKWFNIRFEHYIEQKIADTMSSYTHPAIHAITEHIGECAKGGKRLRPYVAWLTYASVGGSEKESIDYMLYALELFQLFALIHDDIIDNAPMRRGVPCLHTLYGNSQAILAGDLVLSWAMEAAFASMNSAAIRFFHMMIEDTVVGQMLDVALIGDIDPDEQTLDIRLDLKTTRYTFVYPIFIGLLLAESTDHRIQFYKIGKLFGTVFQYLDDISDILSTTDTSGKKTGVDIEHGIPTHLTRFIMHAAPLHRKKLETIFARVHSERDRMMMQKLCIETGAIKFFSGEVHKLCASANAILKSITLSPRRERDWREFIRYFQDQMRIFSKIRM